MTFEEAARARRAEVIRYEGRRCAGWLLRKHLRKIRKHPEHAIRFVIAASNDLPAWFDVAFCWLRDFRSAVWETSRFTHGPLGSVVVEYVIRWRSKPIPEVLLG